MTYFSCVDNMPNIFELLPYVWNLYFVWKTSPPPSLYPFEIESISGERGNENKIYSLFYTFTQPNFPPFVLLQIPGISIPIDTSNMDISEPEQKKKKLEK